MSGKSKEILPARKVPDIQHTIPEVFILESLDEDDEDWDEEESARGVNFAGGPLLYVLIAGAAAAAFFAWRTFMG